MRRALVALLEASVPASFPPVVAAAADVAVIVDVAVGVVVAAAAVLLQSLPFPRRAVCAARTNNGHERK